MRDRDRLRAGGDVHRRHEACRSISTRWRWRAGSPARRSASAKAVTVDLDVPADAEIVIEGLIDPELLEPEGPFGESHGHIALEDFNMSMQVTAITRKRIAGVRLDHQPGDAERSRACSRRWPMEPMFLTHLRDRLAIKGVARVVMHEPLSNLRKVIFVQFAQGTPRTRGLARAARRRDAARRLRQDLHRGERGHRSDQHRRGVLVARLSLQSGRGRAHRAAPLAPGTGRNPGRATRNSTLLIDATLKHAGAAARAAGARIHGARAARSGRSSACRR